MPANNKSEIVRKWHDEHPDKIGLLFSPEGFGTPWGKWALDNGCFKSFNEEKWFKCIEKAKQFHAPLFITLPDVVGCYDRTLALWKHYYTEIKNRTRREGYNLAFVAQDGCTLDMVPEEADWIFIGGHPDTDWKYDMIEHFTQGHRPVHVGRVNSNRVWKRCEHFGVKSIDGTGFFLVTTTDKQKGLMIRWFEGDDQESFI